MGEVVNLARLRELHTPQERVKYLLALVPDTRDERVKRGELLAIRTVRQALAYGDGWQRAYSHLEAAHALALEQLRASEILLQHYAEELERLRRLTSPCA